jgi:hypothetical protein
MYLMFEVNYEVIYGEQFQKHCLSQVTAGFLLEMYKIYKFLLVIKYTEL